jgi:3-oxoacyl-[acyl-carrier-protein] synthase III
VERRIANTDECATDLAVKAAHKLFESGVCAPGDIDYLLLCTQSPDYFLPSSACLVQRRLGLKTSVGAADFNLGCSGFVYGMGLAKGLIETGQAGNVLLITSETYSKYLRPDDLAVRALFGDGAAATFVQAVEDPEADSPFIGPFCYGTDGRGAPHLMVSEGAMRARTHDGRENGHINITSQTASQNCPYPLHMNGPEVFSFAINVVPKLVRDLLARSMMPLDAVQWFVFHQANEYMLEHLRRKIGIPSERFCIAMSHCGNTVSSTIPIAITEMSRRGQLSPGDHVMLIGFGVGYSWAGTMVRWRG